MPKLFIKRRCFGKPGRAPTSNVERLLFQVANYRLGSIRAGQSTVIPCLLRTKHYPLATQVFEEFKAELDQPFRFGVL